MGHTIAIRDLNLGSKEWAGVFWTFPPGEKNKKKDTIGSRLLPKSQQNVFKFLALLYKWCGRVWLDSQQIILKFRKAFADLRWDITESLKSLRRLANNGGSREWAVVLPIGVCVWWYCVGTVGH